MQPTEYCLLWFWTDWWPLCMTKSEWSGWIQAIVGVLAIGGAYKILRLQLAHAERERERSEISAELAWAQRLFVECLHLDFEYMANVYGKSKDELVRTSPKNWSPANLKRAVDTLSRLLQPYHAPTPAFMSATAFLRFAEEFVPQMTVLRERGNEPEVAVPAAVVALHSGEHMHKAYQRLMVNIDELNARLAG